MFDIGAEELLIIVIVAILVIGPKDMPAALRTAGRWIGKMRKVSTHFRTGLDAMIREAEMEDMEKKWKAQNEKIMRQYPQGNAGEAQPTGAYPATQPAIPPADPAAASSTNQPTTLAQATAAEGASAESAATKAAPAGNPAPAPTSPPTSPSTSPPTLASPPADGGKAD